MKILAPRCGCTICSRSSSSSDSPHLVVYPPSTAPIKHAKPTTHQQEHSRPPQAHLQPVPSTSALPFTPPTSVRLPNELIRRILVLARPPTTAKPAVWNAWTRIPLVHSRWQPVAREANAEVVVVRSTRQLVRLIRALDNAWLGGNVVELVFDIKETRSGAAPAPLAPDDDASSTSAVLATGEGAPPTSIIVSSTTCSLLVDLFKRCGATVTTVRWRGFGDPDVARLSPVFRNHLANLAVFEYSPCDSSHPPTADNVLGRRLASLKELVLRPSARVFAPLVYTPSVFLNTLLVLAQGLVDLLKVDDTSVRAGATLESVARAADTGVTEGLATLTVHSLLVQPRALFGLVVPSFLTLRHLALSSIVIDGSPRTFIAALIIVAGTLESFEWTDAPIIGRAGGLEPSLSHEEYWDIIGRLKNVRQLSLSGTQVFASSPHKARFTLPPKLEQLTIGSCDDEVDVAGIEWWLERVDELCTVRDPPQEDAEEYTAAEEEEDEDEPDAEGDGELDSAGFLGEEDELPPVDELGEPTDGACTPSAGSPSSPPSGDDVGAAGEPAPADDDLDLDSANAAPLAHLTPASSPASSPSPAPSPALPSGPPSSPPRPPRSHDLAAADDPPAGRSTSKRAARRRRRLSWAHPPLPPSGIAPQLSHLTLCTAPSPLRDNPALGDRVDALVRDRGVAVEWHYLIVVVLEALELTRELRRDMSEVDDEWA
ncbi:uncharacterized protein RHOBADRAFT_43656 [Rhodotorula graminis WP1]|uniref:Uncharacterized protein n=1 Tax=Rhodotorula graminis (strain WP1) TaxID=578459 RepID=A0A194S3R9_RHOGW|nr:uncharacterized protein RHOBADRAFT_43656 [Rhodotorula graminis WP1]KPV75169.1 hypothetical protein RHOBADRAFT_43656 [Rhodotorula graminis WP1]